MGRSSFQQIYEKTIKFYDFQYHLHKSTFKGLAGLMKKYSECQNDYAQKLFDLSKNMASYVEELNQEMPAVRNSLNDMLQCVSTFSQLHFNYSQRLNEVNNTLMSEYNLSKKMKEKHMKVLKDQFQDKLETVRESKNRKSIVFQQSHVCKKLFEHLDTYAQEQYTRTQKVKQQILIYLALTKKIQQKQLDTTSKFKGKVSQEEIQVKIEKIDQISQNLINQYNGYIESGQTGSQQKLMSKRYDKVQSVDIIRESLKQSTIFRQKLNNMDGFKSRIKQSLQKYEKIPQDMYEFNLFLSNNNSIKGLFDRTILKKSRNYSNLIKTQMIQRLSFDMMNSYYAQNKDSETKLILNTIKGNLRIRNQSVNQNFSGLKQFVDKQLSKRMQMQIDETKNLQNKNYVFHLMFLMLINQLYFNSQEEFREKDALTQDSLLRYLGSRQIDRFIPFLNKKNSLHINISSVLIQNLISGLLIVQQDQPLIIDEYTEYLGLIEKFSEEFFGVPQNIVKLLFLDLVENAIRSTKSKYVEQIHLLIQNRNKPKKKTSRIQQPNQNITKFEQNLIASVVVKVTQGLVNFYKLGIPLINFFTILICVENLTTEKFSAVEYFHKCIKRAGYTYIFWVDEDKKIIEPAIWQGEMRLKNLVQTLEKLEYQTLEDTHFIPTSEEMTHILGVDQLVIRKKLKQQLLEPLSDIIEQNIGLLVHQQGIDKQGYVLKLGVILAQLNIPDFKKNEFSQKYFKVLDLYLNNTEKQYNTLLDHSRKTELWIMEQNTLATQNCIDFCSLLYKPFEFLLKTIKILAQQNKTPFTLEFSQFIKNRLNTILKQQICKYINFLNNSLRQYNYQEPQIHYKPKRAENLVPITEDENAKMKLLFKQIVRRLYNLNFLKSQLDEIIHDFLDEQVYQDLGQTIFNVSNLSKATGKYKQYREIFMNLKDIIETINSVQEKLIYRVSDITVFHFMKQLFTNLYFQQEKSAFQEFFSTKNDYKFSSYTLVKYQKEFEDIFMMVQKLVPNEFQQKYYPRMMSSFFKSLRFQMLNSTKFKIPKLKQQIVRYLDDDITFICTLLKQKYISPQIIEQQLQKPLKRVLAGIQSSTKDLIQKYQTQTLNNNSYECKYILIILYMRPNDQRAQEFFKKFKSIVFK